MSNIGENLSNQRIADYYTSLLHVSGADLTSLPSNTVYDGAGHVTGISLSSAGDRVVINNYIMPEGCPTGSDCADSAMNSDNPQVKDWLNTFYPVGSIMLTTTPNNPMDKIVGTRWVLESSQRFIVGVGNYTDQNNDTYAFSAGGRGETNGDKAGEFKNSLVQDNLPEHKHITNSGLLPDLTREGEKFPGWFPYFGPSINPEGTTQNNTNYRQFKGQGAIVGFQNGSGEGSGSDIGGGGIKVWSKQLIADIAFEEGNAVAAQDRGEEVTEDAFTFTTRAAQIRKLYELGYRYTDADFNPTLANRSLRGWAGPQKDTASTPGWIPVARPPINLAGGVNDSGGPGWGGNLYLDTQQEIARFVEETDGPVAQADAEANPKPIFIGNSPRPIGEGWTRNQLTDTSPDPNAPAGVTYRENVRIVMPTIPPDPRDRKYIHPGELTNDQIIRAFRIVREALHYGGNDVDDALLKARRMFRGVTRLQELQSPAEGDGEVLPGIPAARPEVDAAVQEGLQPFTNVQVPGYNSIPSTNEGHGRPHNNIPPNYGVYVWRRVQADFVEEKLVCSDIVWGCTNPNATNYNSNATMDFPPGHQDACNFTGVDSKQGCTDPAANNYDEYATESDPDNPCTYDPVIPPIWEGIITENHKELDLCEWARSKGWNESFAEARITLAAGKYLWSDTPENEKAPALKIGCFTKLTFINNGRIMGRGGNGGFKGGPPARTGGYRAKGQDGGDAVHVHSGNVIFENYGYIAGGGGGGGGAQGGNGSGGGGGAGGGWGGTNLRYDAPGGLILGVLDTRSIHLVPAGNGSAPDAENPAGGVAGKGDGSWSLQPADVSRHYHPGAVLWHTAGGGPGGPPGEVGGPGLYWWGCGFGARSNASATTASLVARGAPGWEPPGYWGESPSGRTSGGNFEQTAEAGGSGSGGAGRSGTDTIGTGGGGGRIINDDGTSRAGVASRFWHYSKDGSRVHGKQGEIILGQHRARTRFGRGGCSGDDESRDGNIGGAGGSEQNDGHYGIRKAAGGGGGWGAKGGPGGGRADPNPQGLHATSLEKTPGQTPGGEGGYAIRRIGGSVNVVEGASKCWGKVGS